MVTDKRLRGEWVSGYAKVKVYETHLYLRPARRSKMLKPSKAYISFSFQLMLRSDSVPCHKPTMKAEKTGFGRGWMAEERVLTAQLH